MYKICEGNIHVEEYKEIRATRFISEQKRHRCRPTLTLNSMTYPVIGEPPSVSGRDHSKSANFGPQSVISICFTLPGSSGWYKERRMISTRVQIWVHMLGTNLCSHVGTNLCSHVGTNVGTHVGTNLSTHVGTNVGTHVGTNVGTHVGTNVGTHVGTNVGKGVSKM